MELPQDVYDHYWERGWVAVEGVIPPERAKWVAERALELGRAKVGPDSSNYAADRSPDGSVIEPRKLDHPVAQDPAMGRALLESDLPDLLRQLIGVEPVFHSDQIFFKPPRNGSVKHYHQDNAYFLMEPADHVITAWIALDDVDEGNGCMRYISGSHRGPILPAKPVPGHEYDLMPDASLIDLSREELAPVKRGGVVFHHSQVLHGSGANTSERWRRGFATHWIAADVTTRVPGFLDEGYFNRPELFRGWGESLINMAPTIAAAKRG